MTRDLFETSDLYKEHGSRFAPALLAAAIGDALGWPYEGNNQRIGRSKVDAPSGRFDTWTRKVGGRFYGAREHVGAGSYSDDTQLLIATTRALIKGGQDWFAWFAQGELPVWLLYERGGGRATKVAAQMWAAGTSPWRSQDVEARRKYFSAGGNGVAMRVLPHAFADDSWSSLRREVLANGAATHGHPRALVGALLYAVAARCALKKTSGWSLGELIERVLSDRAVWAEPPSRDETLPDWYDAAIEATQGTFSIDWASAVSESDQALHFALQAIRQGIVSSDEDVLDSIKARNSKINGAGTVSAVAAVFLASRYAADPATGIRVAAYAQGVDTDTVASMTGGILGTMIGSDWLLGAWREVQDASLFGRLATDLGSSRHQARGISQGWHQGDLWSDGDSRRLRNALVNCQLGERIHVGPLGEANLEGVDVLDPMVRSSRMTRFRLITADGQRLFVLKPERLRESSQAVLPLSPVSEEASAQSMSHRTQRAGAEHVHAPFRSARSDLAVVVSALPAGTSAIDLHQLLDMAAAAMEVIRSTRSLQHPGLQDDISRSLQSVLAELSIHLPPEAVPALGRTAWRLAAGAERSTPKSARSDGDALSSD